MLTTWDWRVLTAVKKSGGRNVTVSFFFYFLFFSFFSNPFGRSARMKGSRRITKVWMKDGGRKGRPRPPRSLVSCHFHGAYALPFAIFTCISRQGEGESFKVSPWKGKKRGAELDVASFFSGCPSVLSWFHIGFAITKIWIVCMIKTEYI